MRLSQAAEAYVAVRRTEGFAATTLAAYTLQIRLLIRDVGDIELSEVTLQMLRDHLARFPHLKPTSIAHKVRCLRSMFGWWTAEELVVRNPAAKLREPKLPERVPKALNVEEVEELRDACRTVQEHALVEVFFATGARVSEICGLNRNAVDWQRRAMIVLGKGSKERECYLGAKAVLWLRRYLASRHDDDLALFVTERAPHRLSVHQTQYIFRRIARRAETLAGRVTPHVMRHTLATTLLNQGAPLAAVQSLLGHTKSETTLIYARLSGAARQQAFQRYFVQ
jgi:integrase/recombinase XerD